MDQRADVLLLFGATGDLARRRLFPALYELDREGRGPERVVGVARRAWDAGALRRYAAASIEERFGDVDAGVLEGFLARLDYVCGDYREPDTYERIARAAGAGARPLAYLAIPPSMFDEVAAGLAGVGIAERGRVVVEKPFGRDLASARDLNACLHRHFDERSILRIDHYLGKESVESLLVFRFANALLEPVWNRRHIRSIEVTMAEDFGVDGRGDFYESVGALRDVVQNHLLQVVALLAMEPPVAADADALRDEKVKVLRAMEPLDPARLVRGQYEGYREEEGVAAGSDVETYVAAELRLDSFRWAGVPFWVRAGKRLPCTATEALVEFHCAPRLLFADREAAPHPNHLRFRLGQDDGVTLSLETKRPGNRLVSQPVDLSVSYPTEFGPRTDAYVRLLGDALDGDARRFARSDAVEAAWRIVEPALAAPPPARPYVPGSWGPGQADELVAGAGWHVPESC